MFCLVTVCPSVSARPYFLRAISFVRLFISPFFRYLLAYFFCLFFIHQGLDGKIQQFIEWLMSQPVSRIKVHQGLIAELFSLRWLVPVFRFLAACNFVRIEQKGRPGSL